MVVLCPPWALAGSLDDRHRRWRTEMGWQCPVLEAYGLCSLSNISRLSSPASWPPSLSRLALAALLSSSRRRSTSKLHDSPQWGMHAFGGSCPPPPHRLLSSRSTGFFPTNIPPSFDSQSKFPVIWWGEGRKGRKVGHQQSSRLGQQQQPLLHGLYNSSFAYKANRPQLWWRTLLAIQRSTSAQRGRCRSSYTRNWKRKRTPLQQQQHGSRSLFFDWMPCEPSPSENRTATHLRWCDVC